MPQVYIADDNHEFATFVAVVSRQAGWDAVTCENGRQLLDTLREERGPALVLLDINMPVLDGIEAIEEIVDLDRRLLVRFMTGGADAPIIAARMIASARDLTVGRNIFKPVSKARLEEILDEAATVLEPDAGNA
ncbi:response regulator [Tropicimonas sp. IMCC6043]|uniref:response regulator n=1 Tax=Tropicimonas sp. IMCC6043 TaxID=2510645 RepID=UPI0013EDBE03|nr:response regulator [Tropicimonas sp. IMCC6043]